MGVHMPSVAARVLCALRDRLLAINGQGAMRNDLQGRVYLRRWAYDANAEALPAVFIARRIGGGTTTEQKPGIGAEGDTTVIYDIVGVVRQDDASALAGEHLIADLQRALERPADLYLRDCEDGVNLLSQELRLVAIDVGAEGLAVEVVGVGVQCTWPHRYGDPDHVA